MPERFKISRETAFQIVGWIAAALLAYGAVNARVAVLESRVQSTDQRLERMENTIERMDDRVQRIWERVK